jgi:chaperonin cofactor prefoldin
MAAKAEKILDDLIGRVARVRHWLVALGVLKTAAAGLGCVCLYVGLYAWIDHRAHFGHASRLLALLVLIVLLAMLSYFLVRALRRSMTYAYAANYVENRRSFDQQLVAAVEYFERGQDYPYSRTLAEQLVLQVDEAARGFRFDSTVNKWQGYALAGVIALGLSVVGLFVQQNVQYFSSYLSRLFRPLAQIEPLPATVLESVTEDLVVARDAPVTLTAAVQGRTPESAALLLIRGDPNDANAPAERVEVRPVVDSQGNATLTASRSFDTPGRFSYQFEADGASSDVHTVKVCEPPSIKSMTATVSLPQSKDLNAPAYTQQVKDGTLEVLPHSTVELQVECTAPLREASVAMAGGQPAVQMPDGASSFSFRFPADAASSMEFKLIRTDGIANRELQQLRVLLKGDEPPQFKLLCPEGDCLATDVASLPITFEVTDDFGLDAVQLYCEMPNRGPTVIESKAAQGAKSMTLAHTLELEQYDLQIGDSILFYARATDIDTGQRTADANSCSEVYFIEIRPYRQYWHPEEAGRPSSIPGPVPEDLITILEYTRAVLKKTWALANASAPAKESDSRLDALRGDVEYCARKLASTRDDPDNGFGEADKAALRKVGERYNDAGDKLKAHDANAALPPARDAYRLLRQFIDELHLKWTPPQSGQSVPEDKPERVKLQEEPQSSEMDKQRIENQLEQLQRKIDSLAREQKSLSSDLNKALQQDQAAGSGQPDSASSSSAGGSGQSSPGPAKDSQRQPTKDAQSADRKAPQQAREDKQTAGDTGPSEGQKGNEQGDAAKGQAAEGPSTSAQAQPQAGSESSAQQGSSPGSPGTSQNSQTSEAGSAQASSRGGKESSASQGSAPGSPGAAQNSQATEARSAGLQGEGKADAATDARLRMLEAKQKAVREQASQVQAELQQLPTTEVTAQGRARDEAQKHVAQAVEKMKKFEEGLADARYEATPSQDKAGLSESAESARRQLAEAGRAIREGLSGDKPKTAAEQARQMAEQLAADADALDESLSPADRQRMLERLDAAKRLLQNSPDPQWATVSGGGMTNGALVYTKGGTMTPAETARMLAKQFWSIAIEARQKELQPFAEQPSDVEFFQAEKEFFEKAARFKEPRMEK